MLQNEIDKLKIFTFQPKKSLNFSLAVNKYCNVEDMAAVVGDDYAQHLLCLLAITGETTMFDR